MTEVISEKKHWGTHPFLILLSVNWQRWKMLNRPPSCTAQRTFKPFKDKPQVSPTTIKLVHLYLRIFNLSFLKSFSGSGNTSWSSHAHPVQMLGNVWLHCHAQTSAIPKVLLGFEASHVLVYTYINTNLIISTVMPEHVLLSIQINPYANAWKTKQD